MNDIVFMTFFFSLKFTSCMVSKIIDGYAIQQRETL